MISIAIPVYKSRFLDVAIRSVLNQTFTDFELIILNDRSPDNIKEIIKKNNDSRIRYYENDINILPQYFEPFVQKNIERWFETTDKDMIIFKGDGDGDRPSERSDNENFVS